MKEKRLFPYFAVYGSFATSTPYQTLLITVSLLHVSPWKQRQRKYASFLQSVVLPNATVFVYLVTFGEVLIGLGLIFGVLTGIAAFFGVFMNLNFLLDRYVSS